MKILASIVIVLLTSVNLFAQQEIPMADGMRSEGKIYVVVAIAFVILLGLVGYLFLLDKKVTKLEKQLKN